MRFGAKHAAGSADWAVWDHQFDLTRTDSGETYLTRWWLVKTPWGGLALHRMMSDDARETIHTHPFSFVSIPIVGGYIEKRLDPKTWKTYTRAISTAKVGAFHRVNVLRAGLDAHTIVELLRVPTWTLLLVGPHRGTWGFLEPDVWRDADPREGYGLPWWRWTRHDRFDSGHYAPEKAGR